MDPHVLKKNCVACLIKRLLNSHSNHGCNLVYARIIEWPWLMHGPKSKYIYLEMNLMYHVHDNG
jgi:hypothetical protein